MFCQNRNSESGRDLAQGLNIRRLRHQGSRFRGSRKKVVINWGSSNPPEEVLKCRVINTPDAVRGVTNKLSFFRLLDGCDYIPEYTTDLNTAVGWCGDGSKVMARTILQGHSGEGIVVMTPDNPDTFVRAPLYTKYVKKIHEYRVHVLNNEVIDIQRKALSSSYEGEADWTIRNLESGFIFARNDDSIPEPSDLRSVSLLAMGATGLDFGAVDVIYNSYRNKSYVLEINTAPGLVGTTLTNYISAFRSLRNK